MSNNDYWKFGNEIYPDTSVTSHYLAPLANLYSARRTVVDLGCGRGEFLDILKQLGHHPIGVDSSEFSRENIPKKHEFYFDDIHNFLKKSTTLYNALFCYGVLEHFSPEKLKSLFQIMGEKCSTGTEVVFATHDPKSIYAHLNALFQDWDHKRLYASETISFYFEQSNFLVKEVGSIEMSQEYLPSKALTPEISAQFHDNLMNKKQIHSEIKEKETCETRRVREMRNEILYLAGRVSVLESILSHVVDFLNYPMDYYVFAVKK